MILSGKNHFDRLPQFLLRQAKERILKTMEVFSSAEASHLSRKGARILRMHSLRSLRCKFRCPHYSRNKDKIFSEESLQSFQKSLQFRNNQNSSQISRASKLKKTCTLKCPIQDWDEEWIKVEACLAVVTHCTTKCSTTRTKIHSTQILEQCLLVSLKKLSK